MNEQRRTLRAVLVVSVVVGLFLVSAPSCHVRGPLITEPDSGVDADVDAEPAADAEARTDPFADVEMEPIS